MYTVAGAVAGMYGLSKYILDPMHNSLTEARHDFLTHTSTYLEDFNSRLSQLAPGSPGTKTNKTMEEDDKKSNSGESDDSDPTELFHRDIGVQTSPSLSRQQSSWSLSDAEPQSSADTLSLQESRLKVLATNIRDLEQSASTSTAREKDLSDQITALNEFLMAIALPAAHAKYKNPNYPTWSSLANRPPIGDELDRFKAEISRTKGLMLSTRNFPRGTS
jgi:hypothetical protein